MNIQFSIATHARRVFVLICCAIMPILLGACGQVVAAQNAVPQGASQIIAATAQPHPSATVQPAASATAEPIPTATVQPTASATAEPAATSTPQIEIELSGVLSGVGNRTLTIDGKTVTVVGAEVRGTLALGATVKVHGLVGADGSLTAREVEVLSAPAPAATQTASDDGATHDANDDHGADAATHDANDDHGADAATHDANDDHGADAVTHDANDDHGADAATHDANDDHGTDAATHDANDDHGTDAVTHDANDDHGTDAATHDANDDHAASNSATSGNHDDRRGGDSGGNSGKGSGKDGGGHH